MRKTQCQLTKLDAVAAQMLISMSQERDRLFWATISSNCSIHRSDTNPVAGHKSQKVQAVL